MPEAPRPRITRLLTAWYTAAVAAICINPIDDERPTLPITLPGGASATALYDTGAIRTLLSEEAFRAIPVDKRPSKLPGPYLNLVGANDTPIPVRGLYELRVTILGRQVHGHFYVVPKLTSEIIIGSDFIRDHGLSFDSIAWTPFFQATPRWETASLLTATETFIPAHSSKLIKVRAQVKPGVPAQGPITAIGAVT